MADSKTSILLFFWYNFAENTEKDGNGKPSRKGRVVCGKSSLTKTLTAAFAFTRKVHPKNVKLMQINYAAQRVGERQKGVNT